MEEDFYMAFLIAQKKRWAKIDRLVAHGPRNIFIPHILK
jgi:hypothetical protein